MFYVLEVGDCCVKRCTAVDAKCKDRLLFMLSRDQKFLLNLSRVSGINMYQAYIYIGIFMYILTYVFLFSSVFELLL